MAIQAETRHSPSLDESELRHFEELAKDWWDERGKFGGLHAFNPARLSFIVAEVQSWRGQSQSFRPLTGLSVLDIGCGGGILSEPLARLGASVTGIDPVEESIGVAALHAKKQGLAISYREATAERLVLEGQSFDVVVASEVIEHVADVTSFLATCRALCKPGGLFIVSTLNRTPKSYALAIVAAEHILGMAPKGTHEWKKFITPKELEMSVEQAGFSLWRFSGIVFKPLAGLWSLSDRDLSINYIMSAKAV